MKFLRLLLVVALYWTLGASAQESTGRMPPGVLQALAQAGIPESSVGIYVQDVQSERPVRWVMTVRLIPHRPSSC
jgi:hypothetical protein